MPDLPSYAVRLPAPPAGYTVPTGAVAARDSASLATLLASEVPIDIVLTGDTYDGGAGGFTNSKGHRIYAETRGSATFTSGIQLTTLSCVGAVLQGVVFDIADARKRG